MEENIETSKSKIVPTDKRENNSNSNYSEIQKQLITDIISQINQVIRSGKDYDPIEIYNFFPSLSVNILDGEEFSSYLKKGGLSVKTIVKDRSVDYKEFEGLYEVGGYRIKVYRSCFLDSHNFIAPHTSMPEDLRLKICKILGKSLAEKEIEDIEHSLSRNNTEHEPKIEKVKENWQSFIVELDLVSSMEELCNFSWKTFEEEQMIVDGKMLVRRDWKFPYEKVKARLFE